MSEADSGESVRALICEDEPLARRALQEYLKDVAWVEVVGEAKNGREAMRLIHKLEPDLVFMDVRMPGLSGLEVLDAVTHHAAVVFTTAYDEYAIPAFELGAVDYLMKPFGRDRLLETLSRVRVRLVGEGAMGGGAAEDALPGKARAHAGAPVTRLFARDRGSLVPVLVDDIIRVEATTVGVELVTASGTFELDTSLTSLTKRLDPEDFVRVHRAKMVNLAHVVSIVRYDERRLSVRMNDGATLVASRRGSQALKEMAR